MFSLFGRSKKALATPRLRLGGSRAEQPSVHRVALAELTPVLSRYLGQAAYLQLANFETLTSLIRSAPTVASKAALVEVASLSLRKYEGLVQEITAAGGDAAGFMEPFAPHIETFKAATRGADWYEELVTSYVTAGILDDFFIALADGLPEAASARIRSLLSGSEGSRLIVAQLSSATAANPRLASRLALWGRRLVGDTLLIARSALAVPENQHPDEARLEPVFTELIAAHTRRMDDLGLTA